MGFWTIYLGLEGGGGGSTSETITLDVGAFTLTGNALSFQHTEVLEHGSFIVTGNDAYILTQIDQNNQFPDIPRNPTTPGQTALFYQRVADLVNSLKRQGQLQRTEDEWTTVITSDVLEASTNAVPPGGTYTPIASRLTNLDSATGQVAVYSRVGNVVRVSGYADVNVTAGGSAEFDLSLPVESDFTATTDCAGVGNVILAGGVAEGAQVYANATNDRATLKWFAVNTGANTLYYDFQYIVQ